MSIERMADRSLSLAERVGAVGLVGRNDRTASYYDALAALLADIAAADRLARCRCAALEADDAWETMSGEGPEDSVALWDALVGAEEKERAALAAYRARMAQGVDDV